MSKIKQTLESHFNHSRLVFWYDDDAELQEEFDKLELEGVKKVTLDGNEFSLKYQLLKESPDDKFLIYSPSKRPSNDDNWLLDLLLANHIFYADKTSLTVSELGLNMDYKILISKYAKFFNSVKRTESLKSLLSKTESEESILMKMIATAINCDATDGAIVLKLQENEKHLESLKKLELEEELWNLLLSAFAYKAETPSFEDFTYKLLQNHFFWGVDSSKTSLNREAMLLVRMWMDSKSYAECYRDVASKVAEALHVDSIINELSNAQLLSRDTYDSCEKAVILHIKNKIVADDINADEVSNTVEAREHTFWYDGYKNIYKSLLYSSLLIQNIKSENFKSDSFEDAINRYTHQWQKIDFFYRKYIYHSNKTEHLHILKELNLKVENIYKNGYLKVVNEQFQNFISEYTKTKVMHQRDFFSKKIQPFIDRDDNAVVIISDALRYECGAELSSRLDSINRYSTQIESMICSLPSYTQLGMASILPHKELELKDKDDIVYVDDVRSSGIASRTKILQSHYEHSIAISDEEFLALNRDDGREFVKKNKIIFIYHDEIDSTGDKLSSEERVFDAVESSFETITKLVKQISVFNRSNIFVTADHGFLYQNTPTDESEFCKFNDIAKPIKMNRRFIIGKDLEADNCTKKFSSKELNIKGDNDILLANSINKMRVQGGGNRFVHGSYSLQELVIPMISISKKRSDDISLVTVEVMSIPKITTNSIKISLYQKEIVSKKIQPITLKVAFFTKNGELLTQSQTLTFDSQQSDSRNREKSIVFYFKENANHHNNETIKLMLKRVLENSSEEPLYKEIETELKLSHFNTFDEF
jgi:uncharacterized protein (TIGR02687 family)